MTAASHWRIGPDRLLDLSEPRIVGILNVTPDSFSDGGQHADAAGAVQWALDLVREGGDVIDVGGESTRPGAARVAESEQLRRVVPVIERIRRHSRVPISIDTTRADVARAAIDAGADIINDVSAGGEDPAMLPLAAERQCGLVLMHRLRPPDDDCWSDGYTERPAYEGGVVEAVRAWLLDRAAAAEAAGVERAAICLDPGLGFGKTVQQNWALIAGTNRFVRTGYPILGAASRKSIIGAVTGIDAPELRDAASAVVSAMQAAAGIRLLRVHDVALHRHRVVASLAD